MNESIAIAGFITSIVSLLGVFAVVVRLFTKTEVRVDVVEERGKETALLARTTHDSFNGPARAEHEKLVGRVVSLEAEIKSKATTEAVMALANEMRQGFKHLEAVIRSQREE